MSLAVLLLAANTAAAQMPPAELDEWVARYHEGAAAALRENASCLREDRARWEKARAACKDEACRRSASIDRLAELQPLQPVINTPRELGWPARPALVWAFAPAADPVLRPRVDSKPGRKEGRFQYPGDGGYFLVAEGGARYFVIGELGLDGPDADMLPSLVKVHSETRLAATGRVVEGRDAQFDRRYCIYLHRLP
jgi:hypothetical protein